MCVLHAEPASVKAAPWHPRRGPPEGGGGGRHAPLLKADALKALSEHYSFTTEALDRTEQITLNLIALESSPLLPYR